MTHTIDLTTAELDSLLTTIALRIQSLQRFAAELKAAGEGGDPDGDSEIERLRAVAAKLRRRR